MSPPWESDTFSFTLTEEEPKFTSQLPFLRNLNWSDAVTVTPNAACQVPSVFIAMSLSQLAPPMVPITLQALAWVKAVEGVVVPVLVPVLSPVLVWDSGFVHAITVSTAAMTARK